MGIFKNKKTKVKGKAIIADAPEEPESPGEIAHIEELSVNNVPDQPEVGQDQIDYRQVPVCMSQSQINNLVIENNIMLKQIIAEE